MTPCGFAAALCVAAFSSAVPAQAGERLDAIKARGTLLVGTTGDYKPFTFRRDDGTYYGADIVMADRLARRLGVAVQFVPTTWPTMSSDFTAGRFDVVMGGVSVLPSRAAKGPFSTTTYVDGKVPVARCADQDRFTSLEAIDQPGVRVVVNPGGTNADFVRANIKHATLTVHRDNTTVFDEIVANRADVMITDGIEAKHQALINPALCPAHVPAAFTRLEKAYWIQDDPDLVREIDALVETAIKDGEWTRILAEAQKMP